MRFFSRLFLATLSILLIYLLLIYLVWNSGAHGFAIFFAVMGLVCLWVFRPDGKTTPGLQEGAKPKGIIEARGKQNSDLGAELWAGDVADEIIAEMKEKGEW